MANGLVEGKAPLMSGNPDPPDTGDGPISDSAFGELLAEVARGPQPTLLPEGAMVGEYRVVKQLGRGAFGAVYHATHVVIGKQVALKVLSAQFSEDAAMAARFVDEARAVNRIAHPNIVDIFGFGALPDGRKYCVMELLLGETLGACLERRGHLPVAEATEILTQVASALDAAHASAIVHRDLKPDNIFLCRPPPGSGDFAAPIKVKLLDFGIAQIADGLHMRTGSNVMLGTPAYMSPEQCEGAHVDFRSDIYALGVVTFELLTGGLPFQGTNAFQVTSKHLTAQPPAPSERLPGLSSQVDVAVLRMLSKQPSARPDSASGAVRGLSSSLSVPPSSTAMEAVSIAGPPARPRSTRLLALGGGLAFVGVAVVGTLRLLGSGGAASPMARAEALSAPGPASAAAPALSVTVATPHLPTPAQALPSTVTVRVAGQPAGARVFLGKRELGKLGQALSLPRSSTPLSLSVKAPGFARRDLTVTPSEDVELEVKLAPTAAARRNPELEY
jgi:eukaryotic-like serine/threonine-protein kinase